MTRIAPRSLAKLVFVIYFGDAHGTAITPIDMDAAAEPALPLSLDRRGGVEHRHLDAKRWRRVADDLPRPNSDVGRAGSSGHHVAGFSDRPAWGRYGRRRRSSPPTACDPGLDALCRGDFGCVDPPERDYAV